MEIGELEQEFRDYELALVGLTVSVAEEVAGLLSKIQALVLVAGPVKEVTLSYPIRKHRSGFFSFVQFTALPENIVNLKNELALKDNILRFLVVTPPIKKQPERVRPIGSSEKSVKTFAREKSEKITETKETRPSEALSNELLEQKLEEILQ